MSLYKRGKVYWFHFVWNGQSVQRSTKQGNKRIAETIEATCKSSLAKSEAGIVEKKKMPTFKAALLDFLKWSEQEHRAHPATFRRYQVSSGALLRYFKDAPLDKILPDDVERFKTARLSDFTTVRSKAKRRITSKLISPATVNRELACLKAIFNNVLKSDVTLRNPVSRVKFCEENNEQTRVVSYDEQERYLAAATPMLRNVAMLMLETGMRPEEVYRIRRENVVLAKAYLVNPFGKTKAARRRVPLTAAASAVLKHVMTATTGGYLFQCETDASRPVPKVNNAHDRAVKAGKVAAFRLYDLRHTWATRAAMAGVDLVTLAAMLGHSRIQMVLRYAHPTQDHQHQAMEKLERFVSEQRIATGEQRTVRTSDRVQ
jgi:integrase